MMSSSPTMSSTPPQVPSFLANILLSHLSPLDPSSTSPTTFEHHRSPTTQNPSHPQALQTAEPPPNPLYLPPPALPKVEEDLVPPENFALVSSGVYRCGFPKKRNFKFMETLRLKTVLWVNVHLPCITFLTKAPRTLVLEEYPKANLEWCQSQDIQFMVSNFCYLLCFIADESVAIRYTRKQSTFTLTPFPSHTWQLSTGTFRQHSRRRNLCRSRCHPWPAESSHTHSLQQGQTPYRLFDRLHPAITSMVSHFYIRRISTILCAQKPGGGSTVYRSVRYHACLGSCMST